MEKTTETGIYPTEIFMFLMYFSYIKFYNYSSNLSITLVCFLHPFEKNVIITSFHAFIVIFFQQFFGQCVLFIHGLNRSFERAEISEFFCERSSCYDKIKSMKLFFCTSYCQFFGTQKTGSLCQAADNDPVFAVTYYGCVPSDIKTKVDFLGNRRSAVLRRRDK